MIRLLPRMDTPIAQWVPSQRTYEIFASEGMDDYIGCADTIPECREIARDWLKGWE